MEKKLSKKTLNKSFLSWFYGNLTCFSQEHMQTFGYLCVLLLAAFVLALPQTFAKNCSPVLPHSGLKFGTVRDAKL